MKIPWREQLILNPDLKDMRTWPTVLEPLRPAAKIGFDRNRRAVKQVLQGATLRDAAKETGLSIGRISQLLDRCLSSESDSSPALLGGLIPGKHLVTKRRKGSTPLLRTLLKRGTLCPRSVYEQAKEVQPRVQA